MNKGRLAVVVSAFTGLAGASIACNAVLGITDFTAGDGGSRDAGHDGTVGDGGGGQDGPTQGDDAGMLTCADDDGGIGVTGCPCTSPGQLACDGHAQGVPVVCSNNVWTNRPACDTGKFCDSSPGSTQGTCLPVVADCATASPGQQICVGANSIMCGPDLVSETTLMTCSNACVDGGCTGTCVPGASECTGNGVQTCSAIGQWSTVSACSELCSDGGCAKFPSCQGAGPGADTSCGPGSSEDGGTTNDCCSSYEVSGTGATSFYRSYDGVSPGDQSKLSPATVGGFRLDGYEATVGRFRSFVNAVIGGSGLPAAGAGKHTHLNGGSGLVAVGVDGGGFEPGWSTSWASSIATSEGGWDANLACGTNATWTSTAGANEHQPISCITWFEAYAFCIWDGGFLPSEAEWNYAASGGTDQRAYPWSTPTFTDTSIACSNANFELAADGGGFQPCVGTPNDVGSESTAGDGKYLQSDLSGNVWEWSLDSFAPYQTPCDNCANVNGSGQRVTRGGSYATPASLLIASYRNSFAPTTRQDDVGVRCARVP